VHLINIYCRAKIVFFSEYIYLCQDIKLVVVKRKSIILSLVLLVFVMSGLTGCRKYEQIRVTSGVVESLSLNGLRSLDLDLVVGVDNPAGKVVIQKMEGTLKHFGKVIGKVTTTEPLVLAKGMEAEYDVKVRVSLEPGLGVMQVMSLMNKGKLGECTVDVSAVGKVSGVRMKKNYNDIPLNKLL